MKKKGKKKGASSFKLTVKTEDPDAQKMEMQMKKKILQDKYSKLYYIIYLVVQKTKADEAVKKLTEARTRYVEVTQYKSNEFEKYKSIESDFIHQNGLMTKLSQEKIRELDSKIDERKQKIDDLNNTLEQMKIEHEKRLEEKNDMFKEIKIQMETLSNEFSKQLSDIQKELKDQTDKVSQKWEHNPSDHIKSFEKEVQKYDVTKSG